MKIVDNSQDEIWLWILNPNKVSCCRIFFVYFAQVRLVPAMLQIGKNTACLEYTIDHASVFRLKHTQPYLVSIHSFLLRQCTLAFHAFTSPRRNLSSPQCSQQEQHQATTITKSRVAKKTQEPSA